MGFRVVFESGKGAERLIALTFQQPLPDVIQRCFTREGIALAHESAAGTIEAFQSALARWPQQHEAAGKELGALLGLPVRQATNGWAKEKGVGIQRTWVMGILNVTPDSFFDGGRYADCERACQRAEQMLQEGADIIDVGGESTRPDSRPVPAEIEIQRVVPVIRAIKERFNVPISIDTYKSDVAKAALEAGASFVNDITGLHRDPNMAKVCAEFDAGVVVMHIQGTPQTMQKNPTYRDVVSEVRDYLEEGCARALKAGVREDAIWIDPGIGFGKRLNHNLTLIRRLRAFRTLGFPIMIGTSNKSLIGDVLGVGVEERFEGTAATVATAIALGADGVRVHDVKAMKRVCAMTDAVVREGMVGE